MAKNNIWISPSSNGWKVQHENSTRASGYFKTQEKAENRATQILKNSNGGERITQGVHGKIVSKDTINSYDPRNIRDTEH